MLSIHHQDSERLCMTSMYLNALTGRNCQLITVNDYLARRDSSWMGVIFNFLGLTVGCLQNMQMPDERRAQYNCDITYGTNSEFGFDYLRDMGMASDADQLVQRDHYYAIIDEIDSILIDEARTPLIISGPVPMSKDQFSELKPLVADLYSRQNLLCSRLVREAREVLDREDISDTEFESAITKLLHPISVTIGFIAFLTACLYITLFSGKPLALASFT